MFIDLKLKALEYLGIFGIWIRETYLSKNLEGFKMPFLRRAIKYRQKK